MLTRDLIAGYSDSRSQKLSLVVESVDVVPISQHAASPHWCAVSQSLLYVDQLGMLAIRYFPSRNKCEVMGFDSFVGFAYPSTECTHENYHCIVAVGSDLLEVDFVKKLILSRAPLIPHAQPGRYGIINGKCAPDGSLVCRLVDGVGRQSRLFRVVFSRGMGPDSHLEMQAQEIATDSSDDGNFASDFVWVEPNTVFVIDSHGQEIGKYEWVWSPSNVTLKKVATAYKLPAVTTDSHDSGHSPTSKRQFIAGLTLDLQRNIWATVAGNHVLVKVDVVKGEEVGNVKLPVLDPVACVFGGRSLERLFITSQFNRNEKNRIGYNFWAVEVEGTAGLQPSVPVRVHRREPPWVSLDPLEWWKWTASLFSIPETNEA